MPIQFDDSKMQELRYGNTRIAKVYFGNTLIYDKPYIKIKFHFDRTNVNPSNKLGTVAKASGAEWISTSDPQIWYVLTPLYRKGTAAHDTLLGIGKLFCGDGSDELGTLLYNTVGTCQVLEITGDVDKIETLDRIFNKCSAITSIDSTGFYNKFASSTALVNVNSLCNNDSNITDGSSLAGYNILKNISSITTHASTFTNADDATYLEQIPFGWGGTQVPPSTLTTSTYVAASGTNYTAWMITANGPDWTNIIGVYLLTADSISSYKGVSMNRTRLKTYNGLVTGRTDNSSALYFYPAFVQCTGAPGASSSSSTTWVATTDIPNGHLDVGQGNTDMAGTLDYNTYGPIMREYGTYDSTKDVYFTFIVTNVPIVQWNGMSDPYGYLYNGNFNPDAGLRWFV